MSQLSNGINLLPQKEQKRLRRVYLARLFTLLFVLASGVIVVGSGLLAPSYFLSKNTVDSSERYVQALEETVGLKERAGVTEKVSKLAEQVRILNDLNTKPVSPRLLEDILEAKSSNIVITSIAFSGGAEPAFSLSGVSETRAGLLQFVDALKENSRMSGIDIPVSQLALDENLPFSIEGIYSP